MAFRRYYRKPSIDPKEALVIKGESIKAIRIEQIWLRRLISFFSKNKDIASKTMQFLTQKLTWAIDRLSILEFKLSHENQPKRDADES